MDAFVDASILVDIYRGYAPSVTWIQTNRTIVLGVTSTAWLEMLRGAENKIVQGRVATFLMRFPMAYLTEADQNWAMQQFPIYWLSHGVGSLIAAPSHRLQLPLYTRNLKHFSPLLGGLAQNPY